MINKLLDDVYRLKLILLESNKDDEEIIDIIDGILNGLMKIQSIIEKLIYIKILNRLDLFSIFIYTIIIVKNKSIN